jgi:hypothetical protein
LSVADDPKAEKFETWGLLELFGHQRLAGKLTEQTIGGCAFIRIDVPPVGDVQGYTRFFTNGAIYSMTPTTETIARGLANRLQATPVQPYDFRTQEQRSLEYGARFDRSDDGHEDDEP